MRLIPTFLFTAMFALSLPIGLTGAGNKLRDDSFDTKTPAQSVNVSAILISASDEKGETDRRLAAYEATLKRTLPAFGKLGYIGEGSTRIAMPGSGTISLPQGQSVKIEAAYYGENMVWMRVIWMDGGKQRINLVFAKQERGVPVVVAGGTSAGGRLAIVVTPK